MNQNDYHMPQDSSGVNNIESTRMSHRSHKPYIYGLIVLCILLFLTGALFTPHKIMEIAHRASPALNIRIGYGLGMLFIFAVPFPMFISLLSLLPKSKRNIYSFSRILFWSVFIAFAVSLIINIVLVPQFIQ